MLGSTLVAQLFGRRLDDGVRVPHRASGSAFSTGAVAPCDIAMAVEREWASLRAEGLAAIVYIDPQGNVLRAGEPTANAQRGLTLDIG